MTLTGYVTIRRFRFLPINRWVRTLGSQPTLPVRAIQSSFDFHLRARRPANLSISPIYFVNASDE
jgi:hypothetical protein